MLTVSLEILSNTGRGDPLLDLPLSLSQFTEMDKCDNISSLSFSNFPLKTSFAIKSFQKSLETHLRIITPLTSSIGTIIHGDLNGTIILYKKKNPLRLLAMEDIEDLS